MAKKKSRGERDKKKGLRSKRKDYAENIGTIYRRYYGCIVHVLYMVLVRHGTQEDFADRDSVRCLELINEVANCQVRPVKETNCQVSTST